MERTRRTSDQEHTHPHPPKADVDAHSNAEEGLKVVWPVRYLGLRSDAKLFLSDCLLNGTS
jgi:hypothetical protein